VQKKKDEEAKKAAEAKAAEETRSSEDEVVVVSQDKGKGKALPQDEVVLTKKQVAAAGTLRTVVENASLVSDEFLEEDVYPRINRAEVKEIALDLRAEGQDLNRLVLPRKISNEVMAVLMSAFHGIRQDKCSPEYWAAKAILYRRGFDTLANVVSPMDRARSELYAAAYARDNGLNTLPWSGEPNAEYWYKKQQAEDEAAERESEERGSVSAPTVVKPSSSKAGPSRKRKADDQATPGPSKRPVDGSKRRSEDAYSKEPAAPCWLCKGAKKQCRVRPSGTGACWACYHAHATCSFSNRNKAVVDSKMSS
jgi:hypothetical protein